jgi:hypothetical protein
VNVKKPVIHLPGAKASPRRVAPRVAQPDLGPCLLCGDMYEGPTTIRLRHGCVLRGLQGVEFLPLPFDDQSHVKWLCSACALDNNIVAEDLSRFSPLLAGLSADGQCCLCKTCIEPYPARDWSSAILIELGEVSPSSKGPFSLFKPREAGHLHYFCMDDLNLELWRIIERTDEPDYAEFLPCE